MKTLRCLTPLLVISLLLSHGCQPKTQSHEIQHQVSTNKQAKNILGEQLIMCCSDPKTGFYRDGHCVTGPADHGTHIICAKVTTEFLEFSKARGNDLMTPLPDYHFPGLKAGDHWCLCISRWLEALEAGVAPPIRVESTHEQALEYVSLAVLLSYDLSKVN